MTTEEVRAAAEVMLAFADGKEIQYALKENNNWINWVNKSAPSFDWGMLKYRIKPEPKYRPFKTQEECWKEIHKHPDFGWIRNTVTNNISQVLRISDNVVDILSYSIITRTFEFAFQSFKFTDGKPFGIKEE